MHLERLLRPFQVFGNHRSPKVQLAGANQLGNHIKLIHFSLSPSHALHTKSGAKITTRERVEIQTLVMMSYAFTLNPFQSIDLAYSLKRQRQMTNFHQLRIYRMFSYLSRRTQLHAQQKKKNNRCKVHMQECFRELFLY